MRERYVRARAAFKVNVSLIGPASGRDPTIREWTSILELRRVSGPECCVMKVIAPSTEDFELTIDRLGMAGRPTSMFVLSAPLPWQPVQPPLLGDA